MQPIVDGMCRNITELRGLEPAATAEEIEAAARQYVRKVSGMTRPSAANVEAFETAVAEVTATTTRLLAACRRDGNRPRPFRRCGGRKCGPASRPEPPGAGVDLQTTTLTQPALKEWSAAVHAMLDGRQTVLLRKGGIHEKRFAVTASRFLLFPTVAHSHAERVRPEHRDLLDPAAADSTEDALVVRGRARKSLPPLRSTGPRLLTRSRRMHIWTAESVRADRLDFRPKHRLTVLVVQASPLAEPERLAAHRSTRAARAGCRCRSTRCGRTPVHDDADAARDRRARARLSRLTADAVPRAARSREVPPSPRCTVCVAAASRRPLISGSPVPRLRANRGCDPPATSTRMRDPAGNRCATASSSIATLPRIRCARRDIRR